MVQAQFRAFCPFEIGKVEFRFELDRSGQYAPIDIQDAPPEVRVRLVQVQSGPRRE